MHSGFLWAKNLLKLSLKEILKPEKFSIKLNIVVQVTVRAQITDINLRVYHEHY